MNIKGIDKGMMEKPSLSSPGNGGLPEYWVLSLSGGKDSTALGLEWLKRHQQDPVAYPLHEVIYCDVGMEFPAMVEHINRLEQIFIEAGIKFTRLKGEHSFEFLMFDYQSKRINPALKDKLGWGWPGPRSRWCTQQLKIRVIDKYLDALRIKFNVVRLIGLAADEQYRLNREHNQNPQHCHPLVEWGWTEADCLKYCYQAGFDWGGCMRFFAGFLAGAVPFKALMSCESCGSISLICGRSCWIWNTVHGEASRLIIQSINWKSVLHLKKNGLPLVFQSTEPVNLCQHFGSGLKKLAFHKKVYVGIARGAMVGCVQRQEESPPALVIYKKGGC